ncbi:NAD(P)/FAD-dependent oxidoreductase [Stagnihabitans tardus]|uniref:FAD-dependent oxidoreductase n=1 Tax=Stagnihabitans tardus TaxID=2699202 RepID=A0AAE5BXZ9_9RHOB|nr:FAD-binding oxidoreductase [Stagnihabitans tardus]NBZ89868.1 FAD-dependent oxidoreductase [Stagnihabitans tardus]
MPSALIVGAGVTGACLALALSRRGVRVTVIDQAAAASGASGASFGWINASYALNPAHFALRSEGIAAHHRLARDLGADLWDWPGCLWFDDPEAKAAELSAQGYEVQPLTASQVQAREPRLSQPALFLPQEGAVDVAGLARAALVASGAEVILGLPVTRASAGRVQTPAGDFTADHVILANGCGAQVLCGLPMLRRPGLMLVSKPLPRVLSHILALPGQDLRQDRQGRLLAPLAPHHQSDSAETVADIPAQVAAGKARLSALLGVEVRAESVTLAYRPVPGDQLPAIGALAPGLWAAVMHSGATLAPVVAEGLAALITGGAAPLLSPFSPARLLAG